MTTATITKVGGVKLDEPKKGPKPKEVFNIATALDADGVAIPVEEKRLTGLPANYPHGKVKPLGRSDFSTSALFLDFQCASLEHRIGGMSKKLAGLQVKAENARKYKTDKAQKRANRIDQLAKMLADLKAEQAAEVEVVEG